MMSNQYNIIINSEKSILFALKHMDEIKRKLLIVVTGGKYIGLISIGDIQRAIINNHSLSEEILTIMREDYIVANPGQSIDDVKKNMFRLRAEFMPIVDKDGAIVEVYFWEDLFGAVSKEPLFNFNLPVVIMAGGFGTRLRPLTNVLPKPLIPVNEKTLIEEIFERFYTHGCNNFFISLNYKADLIEFYLKQQKLPYQLSFVREEKPLGTAGSLSLLRGKIKETFFVSNCDILIEQDFSEVLKYHKENGNEITLVAALKHYPIEYGIIEAAENGILTQLKEKPELTFKVNSGFYILEPHLLSEIPEDTTFHFTQLIEKVNLNGGKVGAFPVSEKSWKDVGNWAAYLKYFHNDI